MKKISHSRSENKCSLSNRLKPLNRKPSVVQRFDKCEFYIELTRENIRKLNDDLEGFVKAIYWGLGAYTDGFEARLTVRPSKKNWRLVASVPPYAVSKVLVLGPLQHLGNIQYQEHIGRREGKQYHLVPPDLDGKLFPERADLFRLGAGQINPDGSRTGVWRPDFLGLVVVRNIEKLYYDTYMEQLMDIIFAIEDFGVTLVPKRIELCLDTLSEKTGTMLIKTLFPSHFNPNLVYNFHSSKKERGPSPDGFNEYHGFRGKSWRDKRSDEERPRGGRRVYHFHIHEVEIKNFGGTAYIYRVEVQLHRIYLRELMKRHSIKSAFELLVRIQSLLPVLFKFKKLNLDSLHKVHPSTRELPLGPLSVRGQCYILWTQGLSQKEINRFLEEPKIPLVKLCLPQDFHYGVVGDYFQYRSTNGEVEPISDWMQCPTDALWVHPAPCDGRGPLEGSEYQLRQEV